MRFLVCVDRNESSIRAFNRAVSLMKKETDELFLISVADEVILDEHVDEINYKIKSASRIILAKYSDYCKNHNINATLLLGQGSPEQIISEQAEIRDIDCVVVGCRGLNFYKRLLSGSVSKHLVENSKTTVLVVKEKKDS